ncbi:MAG: hypothetical protein AMDU1_APLC00014G0037 [Thermoplasmatales archaeon A-plasma]|jgi:hypothetical protein|nr:MAG: hypothetical protein AMDU1_APLC00014G0037 [Thermoplasmatales archaeon A-plasma]MCL5881094.1 potassium ABC transporter ATPase [Candidatus Thermoplasmatota archaeon]MCL5881780.1 potassium ABC transporter ATPase [Candidatus Thermoplasmatota archaeon]
MPVSYLVIGVIVLALVVYLIISILAAEKL